MMAECGSRVLELCLVAGIISVAVLVRLAVSLHPYSGEGKPPMYGDYEAQRHWMEITYNLPVQEWYENSTNNDLLYWGLDYPPLTAYHSWLCGVIANSLNPAWVSLGNSRGFENYDIRLFMRYTVLAMDVLVYFTAALVFSNLVYKKKEAVWERCSLLGLLLLQPALIIIDHGHFQYNCVSLGLSFWAIIAVTTNYDITGSILFTLALNYKQMELYHAFPFFFYLLGKAAVAGPERRKRWRIWECVKRIVVLGMAVVATFVVCWFPFLGDWNQTLQVLHRLFPFARGLYEDKVANVWCSISVFVKLRRLLSLSTLVKVTGVTTLVALLPSSLNLLWRPTPHRFLLALVNSSLIFFLFSFQVHEKSILLAVLPSSLLTHHHPNSTVWFQLAALLSMYPLLTKDRLVLACLSLGGLYLSSSIHILPSPTSWPATLLTSGSLSVLLLLCVLSHFVIPPTHLPHIFPVLISITSCLLFLSFTAYTHYLQFTATPTFYSLDTSPIITVTKETAGVTKTMATSKQTDNPTTRMYESTGRPINMSFPLVTDKQKKLN